MFAKLKRYVTGRGERTVVHECRTCGATLDPGAEACPYCGPDTEVASYEIA